MPGMIHTISMLLYLLQTAYLYYSNIIYQAFEVIRIALASMSMANNNKITIFNWRKTYFNIFIVKIAVSSASRLTHIRILEMEGLVTLTHSGQSYLCQIHSCILIGSLDSFGFEPPSNKIDLNITLRFKFRIQYKYKNDRNDNL